MRDFLEEFLTGWFGKRLGSGVGLFQLGERLIAAVDLGGLIDVVLGSAMRPSDGKKYSDHLADCRVGRRRVFLDACEVVVNGQFVFATFLRLASRLEAGW